MREFKMWIALDGSDGLLDEWPTQTDRDPRS